jgi:hypothetical protein
MGKAARRGRLLPRRLRRDNPLPHRNLLNPLKSGDVRLAADLHSASP